MAILPTLQPRHGPASKAGLCSLDLAANQAKAKQFERRLPADLAFKDIVRNKAPRVCHV
jgi:hypothetical protein